VFLPGSILTMLAKPMILIARHILSLGKADITGGFGQREVARQTVIICYFGMRCDVLAESQKRGISLPEVLYAELSGR
jgi:hypothetical protein